MSFKITGLDKLQRELDQAQRALQNLDGTIGKLSFNPSDQKSIQNAIRQMETMIDQKVAPYRSNVMVSSIVSGMKEHYRAAIIEKAKEARATSS